MIKLKLKRALIINWRGIKYLDLSFNDIQNVCSANGKGKSSIIDSVIWAHTSFDVQERKNFEIKPRDAEGDHAQLDSIVELWYDVSNNGSEHSLPIKRVWSPIVNGDGEVTGHKTKLWFDSEKMPTDKDFKECMDSLVHPELFKILTNQTFFFNMDETRQRSYLLKLAGDIDMDGVNSKKKFKSIISEIEKRGLDQYKKFVKSAINELKSQIKQIPIQIEEKNRDIAQAPDFTNLEEDLDAAKKSLLDLEEKLALASKGDDFDKHALAVNNLTALRLNLSTEKSKFLTLKSQDAQSVQDRKEPLNTERYKLETEIKKLESQVKSMKENIESCKLTKSTLKKRYDTLLDKEFEEGVSDLICPKCNRPFTEEEIKEKKDTAEAEFYTQKDEDLDALEEAGLKSKETIKSSESQVELWEEELTTKKSQLSSLIKTIDKIKPKDFIWEENERFISISKEISDAELIVADPPINKNKELLLEKSAFELDIFNLTKRVGQKTEVDKAIKRKDDLEKEIVKVNKLSLEREAELNLIDEYSRMKSEIIEENVNKKFQFIKFKLFKQLVKGGDPEECCVATLDGVIYNTVNTAGKVKMFVDLVNTLSEHTQVYVPMLLDNRESTESIPATKTQVISFFVGNAGENATPEDIFLK